MKKKKSVWVEAMESFSMITYIGITMIVCIFGCGFLGLMIDRKMHTKPVFTLIFVVIGVASAYVSLYKTVRKYFRKRK